jgi:GTP-binding protein HflX
MSAQTGAGVDLLLQAISEWLGRDRIRCSLDLEPDEGRLRAWLFEHAQIISDVPKPAGGWLMDLIIGRPDRERLAARNTRFSEDKEGV